MGDFEERAGVVKGLTDAFPETANQVDKALSTTIRAINAALVTIKPAIWGFERIGEWLDKTLPEKLKDVPEGNIITPPINIAGPAIEAMRFTGENDELREMYANLLAKSMDSRTVTNTHPRYIDIIKNITSDEALLLQQLKGKWENDLKVINIFIGKDRAIPYFIIDHVIVFEYIRLENENNLSIYLDNLCHLGILYNNFGSLRNFNHKYKKDLLINKYPFIKYDLIKYNLINNDEVDILYTDYYFTQFGIKFTNTIVSSK